MASALQPPLTLIAELTHRCPLHCVYCSNPLEMVQKNNELPKEIWARTLKEAAELGVLQVDFTGGEPAARPDLAELVRAAREAGLYVNLITSGLSLDERRLEELVRAGTDHLQLSFQGAREESPIEFAGVPAQAQKLRVARWARQRAIGLTLNFVVHRQNLDQLEEMISLTEEIRPERVEFANVQYYGWAFANRDLLLPTRTQLDHSLEIIKSTEERLRGKTRVEYVVPDYYARYPKACMGGWGQKAILITPAGDALPCHAAQLIPGMTFENLRKRPLRDIWENSEAFRRFRGEGWMPEPCKSCDRRGLDFGGCRCQAWLVAGNAEQTDPVCSKSPRRLIVDSILARINRNGQSAAPAHSDWTYRGNPG